MGANIWEQLSTSFSLSDVMLILLLSAGLVIGVVKGSQELIKILGLETKSAREKREYEEKISSLENKLADADNRITKLEASAKKFNEDRINDRAQSRNYQHEYMEIVNGIYQKQDAIIERVDALAEQNRKYELADIRETLLQAYRYYTNPITNKLGMWTSMEAHAFWEQYSIYEDRGGNGYMANHVKPAMNKLIEISIDDHERVAELMASRNINCGL